MDKKSNEKEKQNLVRCFVALELDREAINEIEEIQKLIKKKNLFYGKLTEPENLHLTLKFLGEVEEDKIGMINELLKKIKFKPFEVSLGELGVFINKYNSLLWIKLNGQGIWDLQKEIDTILKDIFPSEERFMSHITTARMKKIFDKNIFLEYIKNMKVRKISFEVKEFILKKSELQIDGPVYTDIHKYSAIEEI